MRDVYIEQDDSIENLALIGEILGAAGVNIEGLCLTTCNALSVIHFVVEDAAAAKHVLEDSGIRITEISEVFVLDKDDKGVTGKPGSFGEICRAFADHNIKINFGYPAENNRFIFGVDDIQKAQELLG
jgi:hypothetical protein